MMASAEEEVEETLPKKETLLDFVWNKKKKAFLGRTCLSWLKIGVFYVIFYACLAGWFAGLLHAFYSTLSEKEPRWHGKWSLVQDNPGVGFRPLPRIDSTLIRFTQGSPGSYQPYVDHLRAFFKTYETVDADETINCTADGNATSTDDKPCRFDIQEFLTNSPCSDDDFGFKTGQPCIALKLNKAFGWKPKSYLDLDDLAASQRSLQPPKNSTLSFSDGNIGISCDGQNKIDSQNLKEIEMYPKDGISTKFYPYKNQRGFRSPLVLAKFVNVERGVLVQVTCRVWDRNVDNSPGKESRGTAHFELLIDSLSTDGS